MSMSFKEYCIKNDRKDLMAQWDAKANLPLTSDNVSWGSHHKIRWRCKKGHTWQAYTYDRVRQAVDWCPVCSGKRVVPGVNDFYSQYPGLMRQWHPVKNAGTDPATLSGGSHRRVWWVCEYGHEWKTEIKSRALFGHGCPICANKKVLAGFNDLATTHPQLVKEWDYEKNGSLTPNEVISGSERKVWWRCEKGHEWQAVINSRTKGSDCPICSGKKIVQGINDLATLYPEVIQEWDSEKNGGLLPTQLGGASNHRVWWKCSLGHSYKAVVASRTLRKSGCPYCTGRKVLAGFNDLTTLDPVVASQWHPTLNGKLVPGQVARSSSKKVWWLCEEGHEWKAVISSRTGEKRCGCPYCSGRYKRRVYLHA